VAVMIEAWEERPESGTTTIYATILAERDSHKRMLVGRQGQRIKAIGIAARRDLEAYLDTRIYLDLKVRLEKQWRQSQRILSQLERAPYASTYGGES
jgi:GTPase